MLIRQIGPNNLHGLLPKNNKTQVVEDSNQVSFNNVLQNELQKSKLQYSKHVNIKMKSLGINMDEKLNNQLEQATAKARQKNIKEGLMLTDKYGFVVSVKNNTVITVVSLDNMEDNVFTNIDGVVII